MNQPITSSEIWGISTPLLLSCLVLGGLLLEMSFWKNQAKAIGRYTLGGLLVVLFGQWFLHLYRLKMLPAATANVAGRLFPAGIIAFGGQYYFDVFSQYFNYIFLVAAIAAVALSLLHFEGKEDHRGEYYLLLVIAVIGMCLMAASHHLLILFVGLETMSISVYVLVGMERRNLRSNEAAIKYLLMGAFASALLLYGMALIYGMTGELEYRGIAEAMLPLVPSKQDFSPSITSEFGRLKLFVPRIALTSELIALLFGVLLFLAGLFFKVAAVPFHMWTPDVYEGAPTPVTAFMSTAVKAAAFAALVRIIISAFGPLWGLAPIYAVLWILAVITMILGNFVAIAQRNLKRMLAYSSIAHAGYLLVGVTAMIAAGQYLEPEVVDGSAGLVGLHNRLNIAASAILFYLLAYAFMNLAAFGVISVLGVLKPGAETLDDFAGLSRRRPGMAAVMALAMLALAGVPPLAGFAGKFYIFQAAVNCRLYWLAVIGVLNSVVSAYFYLRVLVVMYMEPEKTTFPEGRDSPLLAGANLVNALMALAVVGVGLFPNSVISLIVEVFKPGMMKPIIP